MVVGAGINGMAAAAHLAQAGWWVALVDQHERIGGFIAAGERTVPGYRHDTYSSWHPLFVTGPVYAELGAELHRHGLLSYANTDGPLTATVADDGTVTTAFRDVEETVAGFAEPADCGAYRAALRRFDAHAGRIGGLLGSEVRSPEVLGPLWGLARSGGRAELETYAREVAVSGRAWLRTRFHGPEADRLWAPWLLHAGLAPDSASGGLMVPVLAVTLHGVGLPRSRRKPPACVS